MHSVMIAGAGKIGSLIACLLADSEEYQVHLADLEFSGTDVTRLLQAIPDIQTVVLDVNDKGSLESYLAKNQIIAVISCLPYYLNIQIAEVAKKAKAHYFDLTEDTTVTQSIKAIATDATTAFVPQCGLAPGIVGIIANSLMREFEHCLSAKLRVGALPQQVNNGLQYSLTWSTDGLINQYGNPCFGIESGRVIVLKPLEGREAIQIDGCEYEAFNTSGGLGSLAELYKGKIQTLNYKTIRYPGHCEKMRLLMVELKLNEDRETLKKILEHAIPKTYQDIVLIYVTVVGINQGELSEKSYVKKIYPQITSGIEWSAIQASTAAGICAVVDLVLEQADLFHGLVLQENFNLVDVLANRFGRLFA